jgi:hypothetical protein
MNRSDRIIPVGRGTAVDGPTTATPTAEGTGSPGGQTGTTTPKG